MTKSIRIKRIYEVPSEEDGYRILVDRLWPRGISREKADLDAWAKEITPSTALRKEFHHDPGLMELFRFKYISELESNGQSARFVDMVRRELESKNVTLLFAAKDETENHATVLKKWLEERI